MKVLVIVSRRFNPRQFWATLPKLAEAEIGFKLVSTSMVIRDEESHQVFRVHGLVEDVTPEEVKEYDGLLVLSGNHHDTEHHWNDKHTQALVQAASDRGATIGAICAAVPTVRVAARGKTVSFFPLLRSQELLRRAGAIPSGLSMTVDGNLVTAEHEHAASLWATNFVRVLRGEPVEELLTSSTFKVRGPNRKTDPDVLRLRSHGS